MQVMDERMRAQMQSPQSQSPQQEAQEPMEEPGPEQAEGENFQMQNASPQEQEQYDRFVARAMQLMYSEKMRPQVRDMLGGEGDPIEGLARASTMIIARVALAAEKAGEKLMGDVVFEAGKSIVEDLAEYATKWGIHDFETNTKDLEGAYFRTLDMFRVLLQENGRVTPETFKADFDKLVQMNDSGEFEAVLRQLADHERNQRGKQPPPDDSEAGNAMPPQRGLAAAAGGRMQP